MTLRIDVVSDVVCPWSFIGKRRLADALARELGIEGVPFFISDGRLGVSGARPPEVLVEAMKQAAAGVRK